MRFMQEDEALKTIRLFEGASEGKGISRRALKNWVVNIHLMNTHIYGHIILSTFLQMYLFRRLSSCIGEL